MDFGTRLKALREDMELSREELASKLGTSYHSIAKYETNNRFPDKDGLSKMADFFNVSTDYLLCRTNVKNIDPTVLTSEDQKDIKDRLESIKKDLESSKGLMFNGDPLSQDSIDSLLEAMEIGLSMAKLKQKKSLLERESLKEK
jgi:transcriptional regulator with XRE-family HTH domain